MESVLLLKCSLAKTTGSSNIRENFFKKKISWWPFSLSEDTINPTKFLILSPLFIIVLNRTGVKR